jgi:hypothetical protein
VEDLYHNFQNFVRTNVDISEVVGKEDSAIMFNLEELYKAEEKMMGML